MESPWTSVKIKGVNTPPMRSYIGDTGHITSSGTQYAAGTRALGLMVALTLVIERRKGREGQ